MRQSTVSISKPHLLEKPPTSSVKAGGWGSEGSASNDAETRQCGVVRLLPLAVVISKFTPVACTADPLSRCRLDLLLGGRRGAVWGGNCWRLARVRFTLCEIVGRAKQHCFTTPGLLPDTLTAWVRGRQKVRRGHHEEHRDMGHPF